MVIGNPGPCGCADVCQRRESPVFVGPQLPSHPRRLAGVRADDSIVSVERWPRCAKHRQGKGGSGGEAGPDDHCFRSSWIFGSLKFSLTTTLAGISTILGSTFSPFST